MGATATTMPATAVSPPPPPATRRLDAAPSPVLPVRPSQPRPLSDAGSSSGPAPAGPTTANAPISPGADEDVVDEKAALEEALDKANRVLERLGEQPVEPRSSKARARMQVLRERSSRLEAELAEEKAKHAKEVAALQVRSLSVVVAR